MSGHNRWSQIKARKGSADQKRGQLFSKLLKAISIAAKQEPNPNFNPRLRSVVEKAKENNVPNENIERAISKASQEKDLEELTLEAYGPEKTAMIIEVITDNRNRTIGEIRNLLAENGAKMADQGSVLWAFDPPAGGAAGGTAGGSGEWKAKFPQPISEDAKQKLQTLVSKLEEHEDVQRVVTNAN